MKIDNDVAMAEARTKIYEQHIERYRTVTRVVVATCQKTKEEAPRKMKQLKPSQ